MKVRFSHLSLSERRKIERWRQMKLSPDEMARRLGRHRSTIFRELRRNHFHDGEIPKLRLKRPPEEVAQDPEVRRTILAYWRGADELRRSVSSRKSKAGRTYGAGASEPSFQGQEQAQERTGERTQERADTRSEER